MNQWESRKETNGLLVRLKMPQRCEQCVSADSAVVQENSRKGFKHG